jgi:predicted membrane-bound spermidine synthase
VSPRKSLYLAFVVSGIAGLVYEVLWTRYLGLYVGHSAYAQVLVLAVYLGGMALGAMIVADASSRIVNPLRWYAAAEAALALFGLVFHPLFLAVSDFSYDSLFPALGSAGMVGAARWGIAGLLILPQAMILGATFPLMAAAIVRRDASHPGASVARVYLLNTLGGAAGVLLAGFWMIGTLGLPGTSMAAATLNLAAAGIAFRVARSSAREAAPAAKPTEGTGGLGATSVSEGGAGVESPSMDASPTGLTPVLLVVSFGTALASFAYEIGWIRMLSLALGSATHSFELMLSAFILGLALGAWWIRGRVDGSDAPLQMLGTIQVLMGLTAVVSVPLFYVVSFDAVAWMVRELPGHDGGYALFNLGRYGLCLLVMLPSTVLAGMTLPVITGTLIRSGAGEEAIGRVYGINTIGSVAGAAAAGLIALPWLGLKGLILAGAALDVVLGLWLYERAFRWWGRDLRLAAAGLATSAVLFAAVGWVFSFDLITLTSGAYRRGTVAQEGDRIGLYYADGRTATVSADMATRGGMISLSTNGKPDASIEPRWLREGRDTLPDTPIEGGGDYTTQVLAPAIALAFRPDARSVANIGHGSGMSATTFLTGRTIERVVTIEIEPRMVEGSLVFLPANGPAVTDPRSSYVFDDAKSYFAYRREPFDILFAEPSNPWVSGTASLFTTEFYRRSRSFLSEGGVLAQWMQLYEVNDALFLSVAAALDQVFPYYRAFIVGDADMAIVASMTPLSDPDWSVLESEGFLAMTESAPRFRSQHMVPLLVFDQTTLRPLLDEHIRANSDFHPILDLGAERTRFERSNASGTYGLANSRVDLPRLLAGRTSPPLPYASVPAYGLPPTVAWGRAAWLREVYAAGGGVAPDAFPDWQNALLRLEGFLALTGQDQQIASWEQWASDFGVVESALHWGTVGWADSTFFRTVYDFMDRADAPAEARAAVDLRHALNLLDWEAAAAAADVLVGRVQAGQRWEAPDILLDVAVLAYLRTGRPLAARNAYARLTPRLGRPDWDLRNQLLDALITEAEPSTPPGSSDD